MANLPHNGANQFGTFLDRGELRQGLIHMRDVLNFPESCLMNKSTFQN